MFIHKQEIINNIYIVLRIMINFIWNIVNSPDSKVEETQKQISMESYRCLAGGMKYLYIKEDILKTTRNR